MDRVKKWENVAFFYDVVKVPYQLKCVGVHMKKLILALFIVSTSVMAQNFDIPVSKIVKPDYICANQGGAYAIKVGKTPRMWQTDLDANGRAEEGIELQNVKVQALRCINCFDLSGELLGQINVKAKLRGNLEFIKLNLELSDGRGEGHVFEMDCQKAAK